MKARLCGTCTLIIKQYNKQQDITQMESGFSIDPVLSPENVSELVCPLQMGQHTCTCVGLLFVVKSIPAVN